MVSIILTAAGVNTDRGKQLFSKELSKINLTERKLLIVTLSKYGISDLLKGVFTEYGYKAENITIVDSDNDRVAKNIYDIYVSEGNVFSILSVIKKTSIENIIKESYNKGSIYMGSSAGAMIAGKDIICGKDFDKNDCGIADLSALNIIPECTVIPHYTKKELARYIHNSPEIKGHYRKIYNISNDGILIFK